jgi:hypothetical protein
MQHDNPHSIVRRFERRLRSEQHGWSQARKDAAERLRLSLRSMNQGAYSQSITLQRGASEDLRAFERASET